MDIDYLTDIKALCDLYKAVYGKVFRNYAGLKVNYTFWRSLYTKDEIEDALKGARLHYQFWRNRMTPVILLRQKDTNGNTVDRVGEFMLLGKYYKKELDTDELMQVKEKGRIIRLRSLDELEYIGKKIDGFESGFYGW